MAIVSRKLKGTYLLGIGSEDAILPLLSWTFPLRWRHGNWKRVLGLGEAVHSWHELSHAGARAAVRRLTYRLLSRRSVMSNLPLRKEAANVSGKESLD